MDNQRPLFYYLSGQLLHWTSCLDQTLQISIFSQPRNELLPDFPPVKWARSRNYSQTQHPQLDWVPSRCSGDCTKCRRMFFFGQMVKRSTDHLASAKFNRKEREFLTWEEENFSHLREKRMQRQVVGLSGPCCCKQNIEHKYFCCCKQNIKMDTQIFFLRPKNPVFSFMDPEFVCRLFLGSSQERERVL